MSCRRRLRYEPEDAVEGTAHLDEGRFEPVGSEEPVRVDAPVIAATNKDLEDEISKGNFREDLFYRLNVIPFYVPPLRDRKEDIPLLVRHFLRDISRALTTITATKVVPSPTMM